MAKIKDEIQYQMMLKKVEQLLEVVTEDTLPDDPNFIELDLLADLVEEYEKEHYPVAAPDLVDVLKLRMYEMDLTQKGLAELLGVSPSRINEYLTGKSEPTLKVARTMRSRLRIDADIILGSAT